MSGLLRVGAYALLVDQESRILLCRLSSGILPGQAWTLPGGGVDFGEHPRDGAVREVLEETGLVISVSNQAHVDSEMFEFRGHLAHGIRIIYRGEVTGGELRHETDGSTDRCEWFTSVEARSLPLVSLARIGIDLAFGG